MEGSDPAASGSRSLRNKGGPAPAADRAASRPPAPESVGAELDKCRALLEIDHAMVSDFELPALFGTIAPALHRVVPHDYATLALHDPSTDVLSMIAIDAPLPEEIAGDLPVLRVDDSISGRAFRSRRPVVLQGDGFVNGSAYLRLTHEKVGFSAICCIPLIACDRAIGTLNLFSRDASAFDDGEVARLVHASGQLAVGITNGLRFREALQDRDRLAREKRYLEEESASRGDADAVIGESAAFRKVLHRASTVARTRSTVLILGETGTGKEVIGRLIHRLGDRRQRTLVKVNCAAVPSGLLEAEWFGHEKGAFTGATGQRIGRFELADRGTLFLDEVGDIPLDLQPKLLRVLQEHEFERLGSARSLRVDFRLIAATNRDLSSMVTAGGFRSDLFYRLNVFPIRVPPLRERADDIPALARHFAVTCGRRLGRRIDEISRETIDRLAAWHWPGNVRELENVIERAVILSTAGVLRVPASDLAGGPSLGTDLTLAAVEREHILRILKECDGVVGGARGAASRLGLRRTTLLAKMRRLGIAVMKAVR